MIMIPDHILQQIIMFCQANNIAMATIGSPNAGVYMFLFGERDFSPDQASIVAAHMLLSGVISGGFAEDNQRHVEEEKLLKENPN